MIVSNVNHSNASFSKIVSKEVNAVKSFCLICLSTADDNFIPTNYQKIIAKIAALPLAQANFRFLTEMTSLQTDKGNPGAVSLTTSDEKEQYFDDVVITTPLGWLKQHKESIPQLYPRIASAIDSMSFGRLEKVSD